MLFKNIITGAILFGYVSQFLRLWLGCRSKVSIPVVNGSFRNDIKECGFISTLSILRCNILSKFINRLWGEEKLMRVSKRYAYGGKLLYAS